MRRPSMIVADHDYISASTLITWDTEGRCWARTIPLDAPGRRTDPTGFTCMHFEVPPEIAEMYLHVALAIESFGQHPDDHYRIMMHHNFHEPN